MELLKQSERFTTCKEEGSLKETVSGIVTCLRKLIFWLENIYGEIAKRVNWNVGRLNKGDGISDTFTTTDGKTITVENGVITKIE